jgi:hypothetical protein
LHGRDQQADQDQRQRRGGFAAEGQRERDAVVSTAQLVVASSRVRHTMLR